MKRILQYTFITSLVLFMIACGEGAKEKKGSLGDKKVQLEKLKKDAATTAAEIKKLEEEILKLDTSAAQQSKAKLIAAAPVSVMDFSHYIDLQGTVTAEDISYIAPANGMGGVVTAIYIKEGQYVKKGQLILKMDDKVLRTQLSQLNTQLDFAKDIYNRQKNLWEQNIGSEVQLITAKNNVEAIEKQMATLNEQIRLYTVTSSVNGVADIVDVKVGEMFTGAGARGPQIQIVNNSTLKVKTNVPENYMSRVRVGSPVIIALPDAGKTYNSTITLSSQLIDPNSRTFAVEASIPGGSVRPNTIASIRIKDYSAPNAIVIPVNLVQTDENGKYVYALGKDGKGRTVAVKKPVVVGESYNSMIEIKGGLQAGMQLITAGYQSVYDKQVVQVDAPQTAAN
jgi:membrane fusion protein, multidrug efflux system